VSLGHPSKFQRVSRLGFVRPTAAMSLIGGQPNFARCLIVSCAATLYIHFRGLLPPHGISPRAKFTLRPSLAFSRIGSVTARHSSSLRQPNFAAWYKEWNYRTLADGASYIRLGVQRSSPILVLSFFLLSSFFPRLISAVADWIRYDTIRCTIFTCAQKLTKPA